jgi:hypothetical protein
MQNDRIELPVSLYYDQKYLEMDDRTFRAYINLLVFAKLNDIGSVLNRPEMFSRIFNVPESKCEDIIIYLCMYGFLEAERNDSWYVIKELSEVK